MPLPKNNVVLDSSALLAYYNDEPGWQQVETYQRCSVISAVNAAEVISTLIRNGTQDRKAYAAVHQFVSEVMPYDDEQAYLTGKLITKGKQFGLSLGDRACISLALQQNLPVLTSDRIWQDAGFAVEVWVFR